MSIRRKVSWLAGCLLLAATPALAVNGGVLDGNAHPAIVYLYGTLGTDPCTQQVVACSGTLIAPSVVLTSAACADALANPEQYGYTLQAIWASFDGADPFGCANVSLVTQSIPNPAFDETARDPIGNVGVLLLSAPASTPPVDLPTANLVDSLPASQPYTAVGFGDEDGGLATALVSLARRSATADFKRLDSENLTLSLNSVPGGTKICIGTEDEGGAAFLGTTNEVVALAITPGHGSCATTEYQRLDVPSVRTFLGAYVTLP